MYVCICHSVTERDIKKAARQGAETLHDIKSMTGCATGCGSCSEYAVEILEKNMHQTLPSFLNIFKDEQNRKPPILT